MDTPVNFKKGDRVRKADGSTFSNGQIEVTVDRVKNDPNDEVWFEETGSYLWPDLLVHADARKASSGYPDDNPKTALGTAKPSLSVIPPVALFHMGQAMQDGKAKYGLMNWREHKVSSSIYYDAAMRHLMAWWDGENRASDSGVHHLAHAMACLGIILDAEATGQLNDDRPLAGNLPAFLKANTKVNP